MTILSNLQEKGNRVIPGALKVQGREIKEMIAPCFTERGVREGWRETFPVNLISNGYSATWHLELLTVHVHDCYSIVSAVKMDVDTSI